MKLVEPLVMVLSLSFSGLAEGGIKLDAIFEGLAITVQQLAVTICDAEEIYGIQ
jgi:hypothetical protein